MRGWCVRRNRRKQEWTTTLATRTTDASLNAVSGLMSRGLRRGDSFDSGHVISQHKIKIVTVVMPTICSDKHTNRDFIFNYLSYCNECTIMEWGL